MSKELKRKADARLDGDQQANKRPKLSTDLQIRRTMNLCNVLTIETIRRVRSRFVEAYRAGPAGELHAIYPKLLEIFEPFDVHSSGRSDRVRAIARLHNEKLTQGRQEGVALTESQSWKNAPDFKARGTPLQVMYNWYHKMQSKEGYSALRIMAEHFGQGIVVLRSPIDFLK